MLFESRDLARQTQIVLGDTVHVQQLALTLQHFHLLGFQTTLASLNTLSMISEILYLSETQKHYINIGAVSDPACPQVPVATMRLDVITMMTADTRYK